MSKNAKIVQFNEEARTRLINGVNILADAVASTLGPSGKNVVISKEYGGPHVTKDGVTVAKEIELADPIANMGAALVKEAASKTADVAGDGTTTATVLARIMINLGLKHISNHVNVTSLRMGMEKSTTAVVNKLKTLSKSVSSNNEIKQVATLSANGDTTIGELIANAMAKVNNKGVITIEEAKGNETTMELVEGMQFEKGYISHFFVTNQEKMTIELEKPYILLTDKKITAIKDILPILENVVKTGRPLLIIAEDLEGEALATLLVNKMRGSLNVAAVKAPAFGDRRKAMLEDIAILTNGTVVSDDFGIKLESVTMDMLGSCERVQIDKDTTVIVDGSGTTESINSRVAMLNKQIEECTSEYDREKLQERVAKLSGGVAVINIGAATETELKEKRDRVEDALHATRAAVEEGIVSGGGLALIQCKSAIDELDLKGDELLGAQVVKKALEEPMRQIVKNAGLDQEHIIVNDVENRKGLGYNARTCKWENLIETGVVDPTKVTRTALENATSIAVMVLTTNCVIADIPKTEEKPVRESEY